MADSVELDVVAMHYNFTGNLYKSELFSGIDFKSVIFIIVCCFMILKNVFVILTIWRTKDFHTPMYYFIGNLTLSDLLAGAANMCNIRQWTVASKLTASRWFLRKASLIIGLSASLYSLLAIAVERYVTVRKMSLHNKKTSRVSFFICACCFAAASVGMLPTMGWNCIGNLASCSIVLPLYSKSYILFCITTFSVVLIAIISFYVRIYVLVRRRCRDLVFHTASSGCGSRISDKSLALLRVVVIVLSVFIACWMPLFVLLLLDVTCDVGKCFFSSKRYWFLTLPLLHSVTSKDMRSAFVTLLSRNTCSLRRRDAVEPSHQDQPQRTRQLPAKGTTGHTEPLND